MEAAGEIEPQTARVGSDGKTRVIEVSTVQLGQLNDQHESEKNDVSPNNRPNIPDRIRPIFEHVPVFQRASRLAERLANIVQQVEQTLAYKKAVEGKNHREYSTLIRAAGRTMEALVPVLCCACHGIEGSQDNDPCSKCNGRGYLTAEEAAS